MINSRKCFLLGSAVLLTMIYSLAPTPAAACTQCQINFCGTGFPIRFQFSCANTLEFTLCTVLVGPCVDTCSTEPCGEPLASGPSANNDTRTPYSVAAQERHECPTPGRLLQDTQLPLQRDAPTQGGKKPATGLKVVKVELVGLRT